MSSIPKSQRKHSKLNALHVAYQIRKMITDEVLVDFGLDSKKEQKYIESKANYIHIDDLKQKIKGFHEWYITYERTKVLEFARNIVVHLIKANSIYITCEGEYAERRLEWDRAIAYCTLLMQELQYIAETLPNDLNRFIQIILKIDECEAMIKGLRKSDNKLKGRF